MPTEFGPAKEKDEPESGLSWWVSGSVIYALVKFLDRYGEKRLRYGVRKNRLSIHGECDSQRKEFRAGFLVGFLPAISLLCLVAFGAILLSIKFSAPTTISMFVVFPAMLVWAFLSIHSLEGLGDRMETMTVFDHTTPPTDEEALESLQQQFVDGDLDEAELADRVEAVIDR